MMMIIIIKYTIIIIITALRSVLSIMQRCNNTAPIPSEISLPGCPPRQDCLSWRYFTSFVCCDTWRYTTTMGSFTHGERLLPGFRCFLSLSLLLHLAFSFFVSWSLALHSFFFFFFLNTVRLFFLF